MGDSGDSRIQLTEDMLSRIVDAAQRNPQTVARVVGQIAEQVGTNTGEVVRAVRDAAAVVGSAALGLAKAAASAVDSAISAGSLSAPGAAAAGAAGPGTTSSGGGIVSWFNGLSVVGQVASTIGAVVLATTVATSFGPVAPAEGFQAIGVEVDGATRIVSVRHTDAISEGIAPCRFRHGGSDCDGTAEIVVLDPAAYETAAQATEVLCAMLDGPRTAPALSDGWSVPYEGGTVTLDDWGHVDFEVCDEVLEG